MVNWRQRFLVALVVVIAAVLSVNAQTVNPAPPEEPAAVAAPLLQDSNVIAPAQIAA